MDLKDEENKTSSEPTSPKKIVTEILTIIILLVGGLIIELLKSHYGNSLPSSTIIILSISELTLIIYFVTAFIRALRVLYKEFDELVLLVRSSNSWQLSKQSINILIRQFRNIDFRGLPWKSIFKQLGIALLIATTIVAVLLLFLHIDVFEAFYLTKIKPSLDTIAGIVTLLTTVSKLFFRKLEQRDTIIIETPKHIVIKSTKRKK